MKNDQIFTPSFIVEKMLSLIQFEPSLLLTKTIMEPSFGDGAFLRPILEKTLGWCEENNVCDEDVVKMLGNIYGIEIDTKYHQKTLDSLNTILAQHNIDFQWKHLYLQDTLDFPSELKFDYIIGNPPYIRIHDLPEKTRNKIQNEYKFCSGMTDLYITFFEWGLNHLNSDGKLCFIAPNSWITNSSQSSFRRYLKEKQLVENIIDYHKLPVFGSIATYTAIVTFGQSNLVQYTKMATLNNAEFTRKIPFDTLKDKWVLSSENDAAFLKRIQNNKINLSSTATVQNGIATNADKIYIVSESDVKQLSLEKDVLKRVVKGSTLDETCFIIFPYQLINGKFKLIEEAILKEKYPNTYQYLLNNKDKLLQRDMDRGAAWYQFGRSQGIQNSHNSKLVIQHIVAPEQTACVLKEVGPDVLVYSGIYIVPNNPSDIDKIKRVLQSKAFCRYVKICGKDMSGGYKSFNTKLIKDFKYN